MRIRSKLLVLAAIPILAISLAAGLGLGAQNSAIKSAEFSLDAVSESQTVHDAVLAIGQERLHRFGAAIGTRGHVETATDAATATAEDLANSEGVSSATSTVSELIASARQADQMAAIDLYTEANRVLLTASIDDASGYPNAEARNDAVVNRLAVEALEARETAWLQYLAVQRSRNNAANTDPTYLAMAFADGRSNFGQASIISGGTSTADINSALQSAAAQRIAALETVAIDDLGENAISVTDTDALDALVAFRNGWIVTIDGQAASLRNVVDQDLTRAKNLRLLFTVLAIAGAIVTVGLIFVIYRSITAPIEALLKRAEQVAHRDLPDLITTLDHGGGSGELPEAEPIPVTSNDEIGDLVVAFNNVQTTAYDLATEQALGRRAVGEIFVNLGRRNQQLLQRMLRRLTELQRDEEDPERLESLFELDNLVTRMRRNAESLLVMAGATTPRQWTKEVDIEKAVRAAFGEVEGYQRIDVSDLDEVHLRGDVVADVSHLLAELLENALKFSKTDSRVMVSGRTTETGFTLCVVDRGIGMTTDELDANNQRISDPPPLDQIPTKFLGLLVVGRLAERHGITVVLNQAPGRGVNAQVELPESLLVQGAIDDRPIRTIEESSPLNDGHDLDAELAELTGSANAKIPHSNPNLETETEPQLEAEPQSEAEPESQPEPESESEHQSDDALISGLPVRNVGETLNAVPGALPERQAPHERVATDASEDSAGNFSSMMSALSTGISRGLQDSDEIPEGEKDN